VTAACLAELGHNVTGIDLDAGLVAALTGGRAPFHEPQLDDVLERNLRAGRLSFTTSFEEGARDAQFALLCVGTPAGPDGSSDLSAVASALTDLTATLSDGSVIVTRSTVPIGTNASIVDRLRTTRPGIAVVSNPEFLREGHAVADFLQPERIVIGAADGHAGAAVASLYECIGCPILRTDYETAEVIKYASNSYLAAQVSFINEIANICERTGADVTQVSKALSLDKRIGEHAYLSPGIGYGGSCLPKDLSALVHTAEARGYEPALLKAIIETNETQPKQIADQLEQLFQDLHGLKIGVLGISFKGNTFDIRSSPALSVIETLAERGAQVHAFDPHRDRSLNGHLTAVAELHDDAYGAAAGASAVVVATDHREFLDLDLGRLARGMATPVLIDGRNLFEPEAVSRAGFSYIGVGRPRRGD
jgi:UDPglucose 6-dehydrogenase